MIVPLVIEYVFEGQQLGYNFTSPTRGYSEDTLKTIWRQAMPRGQGWGQYTGATTLKCFPLRNGYMAASNVVVTDLQDETGRRGIRRAEIEVMTMPAYIEYLKRRFDDLPQNIQTHVHVLMASWNRLRPFDRIARKINKAEQVILSRRFTDVDDWKLMEGVIIKLALTPFPPLKRAGLFPFTTLAMAHHDEGFVVALPAEKVGQIKDVPVVAVD